MANQSESRSKAKPRCVVIAGPNGSGKTTFATEFLEKGVGVVHFINADLIASGLSPIRPQLAAIAAGRLLLAEIDRLAGARLDFAFESTSVRAQLHNFVNIYRPLADRWAVYDNSAERPQLVERS